MPKVHLGAGLLAGVLVTLSSCDFFRPAQEVVIPLPVQGEIARVQVWANTMSEGRFEVVIQTPKGSARHELWEDWGPAQRVSLYYSPDGRLVVLGGGGNAEMFRLTGNDRPKWMPSAERPKETGDDWKYIGAADGRPIAFLPPASQRECIPLYGAGSSPYRKTHQDQRSCSDL